MTTFRLRSCALIVALVLLSGCSSTDAEQLADDRDPLANSDVSDASEEQAAEISDREVTLDEYEAAFQRYRECLSAAGFELRDLRFERHRYRFGVPGEAVESGVDDECYNAEFRYVDMIWQSSDHVRNSSDTAQFTRECLQDHGIEPADTLDEMDEQLEEAGLEWSDCL